MAKVVVCEDDRVLRGAITALCEDIGLEVVAETDSGSAAIELIRRFDVHVLVLDQSLPDMTGDAVIEAVRETTQHPEVVVFSAYVGDADHLISLGARDVVDKPDFERLESVLESVVKSLENAASLGPERRARGRRVEPAPRLPMSPSGAAPADELLNTALHTESGDSVLVVAAGEAPGGDVPLIELLRSTLRVQDVLHEAPHLEGYVAVLRGGDVGAAPAVWRRLIEASRASGTSGDLRGAWRQVDGLGMMAAVAEAEDRLAASLDGDAGLQPA